MTAYVLVDFQQGPPGAGGATPSPSTHISSATNILSPAYNQSYAVDTSAGTVNVNVLGTAVDGVILTFYDTRQSWVANQFMFTAQAGGVARNAWDPSAVDASSVAFGGPGNAVNGQGVQMQWDAQSGVWFARTVGAVPSMGASVFVFKPGGTTLGNVYATASGIQAALSLATGPCRVQIDISVTSPAVLPTGVTWDLHGGSLETGNFVGDVNATLVVQGTAYVMNASLLTNLIFEPQSTTTAALQWGSYTSTQPILQLDNCEIFMGSTCTAPPIQIPGTGTVSLVASNGSYFNPNSQTTVFVELLTSSGTLELDLYQSEPLPATFVGGTEGALFAYNADASGYPYVVQTGFSGTVTTVYYDNAAGIIPAPMTSLTATTVLNPQTDISYDVETTGGAITATLAGTIPDGTKITFYDESQSWVTNHLTIVDAGGYTFRVPWNVSGADAGSLVMGGAGDAINGQSITIQKKAGKSKWLC